MSELPKSLYNNNITEYLNEIRLWYIKLSGRGMIYGIMCADQDAKIIAVNSFFDKKFNIWDISALGAAIYGVSRQGVDCFGADFLERGSLTFGNMQFFVRSIGSFQIDDNRGQRELVIIVLADKAVNQGLMILQMNKYAEMIKQKVVEDQKIKDTLMLSETEMMAHIKEIKNELFKKAESMNMIL
jgi:predicted regulator of Ras-like GTPase activity (Roadblock/LC7/MglB family)